MRTRAAKASRALHHCANLRPILQQTMWETLLVEKGRRITISRKKLQLRRNLNAWPAMFLSLSITEAASMRTESRDSHFRADNPGSKILRRSCWIGELNTHRFDPVAE